MNPVIKPISVVLKEARESKGISLDEAHKATKIHPRILHSLEEGTTLELNHVYVKSYIKIYAKYLEINQQELDKYFRPVIAKEKKISLDIPLGVKGEKIKSWSKLNILSLLPFEMERFKKAIVVFIIFFLALVLLSLSKCAHKKETVPPEKVISKDSSPILEAKVVKTKPKTTETKKEPTSKIDDVLRLTIFAELDTWMQVKVDGKIVFKRTLKKSSSETWQAKNSFELWLANAGTVKLELNGKILGPIGRRGQLLKSVLITKDGLAIKK